MNMPAKLMLVGTADGDAIASRPTARPVNLPDAEQTAVIGHYSRAISTAGAAVGGPWSVSQSIAVTASAVADLVCDLVALRALCRAGGDGDGAGDR